MRSAEAHKVKNTFYIRESSHIACYEYLFDVHHTSVKMSIEIYNSLPS